MLTNEAEL